MEITWRWTITWNTGEIGCRILQTLRAFGIYLSSIMIVCISVDRYFAIVHPLKYKNLRRKNTKLLAIAYLVTILISLPQLYEFILLIAYRISSY
ncbi:G protein-coupled receptor-like protein [Dinothrombium tinctorium]|uniref:G protein-coupled receptor-like protein n=1 Tax=Dinothrombium tinctorium TaxID=1965070 RepID=A0A3S3RYY3_9ACAR|nr:G protein-coupled receptor-like protein [Dinothrombium tinctorium]RWS06790.1 G protein-coupled receptor-like protein [Dinothrombium tinctorium]